MDNNSGVTIRHDTAKRHLHKYSNPNLVHRLTLNRFFDAVVREIQHMQPDNVLEFGCGEGLFLRELKRRGVMFKSYLGLDIRHDAIVMAKELHPEYTFVEADFLSWDHPTGSFDLVICSQVLEHLLQPEIYLQHLAVFSSKNLLLTVPWEPWFRLMNLLRGRDIRRLGNHPEHVNHWGVGQFAQLVKPYAHITDVTTVFPFILVAATVPGQDKQVSG